MYLDCAVGLIIGSLVSLVTGALQPQLLIFGVFATLAPDIDFIVWLIRHDWKVDQFAHEHRDLFHSPLLFGLAPAIIIGLWQPLFGVTWFLGTISHFIHDTFDGGWGIRWLHPFSHGYFTFASYSPQRYFKDRIEQRAVASVHGNPRWLTEEYFKPNRKLFKELALFMISLGAVIWLLLR